MTLETRGLSLAYQAFRQGKPVSALRAESRQVATLYLVPLLAVTAPKAYHVTFVVRSPPHGGGIPFGRKTFSIDWAFLRNSAIREIPSPQSISFLLQPIDEIGLLLRKPAGYETGGKLGEDLVHIGSEYLQVRFLWPRDRSEWNSWEPGAPMLPVLTCSISTKEFPFPVISR